MKVSIKEEFQGYVYLRFFPLENKFKYAMCYKEYPDYTDTHIILQEGDTLTLRHPDTKSILIERVLDFDYDYARIMDEDGRFIQLVDTISIDGVQKGIEPSYWISLFIMQCPADLTREQ